MVLGRVHIDLLAGDLRIEDLAEPLRLIQFTLRFNELAGLLIRTAAIVECQSCLLLRWRQHDGTRRHSRGFVSISAWSGELTREGSLLYRLLYWCRFCRGYGNEVSYREWRINIANYVQAINVRALSVGSTCLAFVGAGLASSLAIRQLRVLGPVEAERSAGRCAWRRFRPR